MTDAELDALAGKLADRLADTLAERILERLQTRRTVPANQNGAGAQPTDCAGKHATDCLSPADREVLRAKVRARRARKGVIY